jgi:hypothetical protein
LGGLLMSERFAVGRELQQFLTAMSTPNAQDMAPTTNRAAHKKSFLPPNQLVVVKNTNF